MILNSESVRLVTRALEEFFATHGDAQEFLIAAIKDKPILLAVGSFGNANDGDAHTEFLEDRLDAVHLRLSAVDDHKVGEFPARVRSLHSPPP